MIFVDINTDKLEHLNLTQGSKDELLEFTVKAVTTSFLREWDNQAKQNLGQSQEQYRTALEVDFTKGRFKGIAKLNAAATLPNMIEMGAPSWDMKAPLLASGDAKEGKDGMYIDIPFRYRTEEDKAANGENNEVFSGALPSIIHKIAKGNPKKGIEGQRITSNNIPESYALKNAINELGKLDNKKNYLGIHKGKKHGDYVKFRRVSLNSSDESWIHPGFVARDLAGKALSNFDVNEITDTAINIYLGNG